MRVQNITDMIGNTPLLKIDDNIEYYAKIEGSNLFGSVKDRAARYLMENAYNDGIIKNDTVIIESSSGNFGIALAGMCKIKGNSFICVVDPNITELNRKIIELLGAEIVVARKADKNGNYVQDRIQTVKEYVTNHTNAYWTNQYENEYVWKAYFSLGEELCNEMEKIDYLFVAVSTCGTLAGTSQKIKEQFPNCKIVAVDIVGSQIFEQSNRKKHISGIGTGLIPQNLVHAKYDDYMIIEEVDAISECNKLLTKGIVVGASSGAVAYAIQNYTGYSNDLEPRKIVGIFPDRGERYLDTIYDKMAAYSNHASASRTVIDYTTASSSAKSVAAAKAASDSNLKKRLTFVKNTASKISDTSTYLKADDDTQRNITISSLVKKNYFVSQVYKYIIKYDPNKEKVYAFGDLGKKTEKAWDLLVAN